MTKWSMHRPLSTGKHDPQAFQGLVGTWSAERKLLEALLFEYVRTLFLNDFPNYNVFDKEMQSSFRVFKTRTKRNPKYKATPYGISKHLPPRSTKSLLISSRRSYLASK